MRAADSSGTRPGVRPTRTRPQRSNSVYHAAIGKGQASCVCAVLLTLANAEQQHAATVPVHRASMHVSTPLCNTWQHGETPSCAGRVGAVDSSGGRARPVSPGTSPQHSRAAAQQRSGGAYLGVPADGDAADGGEGVGDAG